MMTLSRRVVLASAAAALAGCGQSADAPTAERPHVETTDTVPPGAPGDPRPRSYALIDQPAPDFALPKLGGGEAKLADYRGKVLVLYFGGLWCPDCMADGPNTNALAQRIAGDPRLAFLNIHTRNRFGRYGPNDREREPTYNEAESATALTRYFDEKGYLYPVAFDASRSWAKDTYKIDWSPSFVIVDKAGVIRRWRTELGAEGAAAFFAEAQALAA